MPFAVVGGLISAFGSKSAADTSASASKDAAQVQQNALNLSEQNSSPYRQAGAGALGLLSQMYGIPYDYGQSMPSNGSYGYPGSQTSAPASGTFMGLPANKFPGLGGGYGATGTASYNPPPGSTTTGAGSGGSPNFSAFFNSPGYQFAQQQGQQAINRGAAASGNLYSSNTLANLSNYSSGLASQQYNNYVQQLFGIAGLGGSASTAGGAQAITGANNVAGSLQNAGNAEASGVAGAAGSLSNLANNSGVQNTISSWFNGGGTSGNGISNNSGGGIPDNPFG